MKTTKRIRLSNNNKTWCYTMLAILFFLTQANTFGQVKVNTEEKTCVECHEETVEKDVVHGATNECVSCHESNGKEHPLEGVVGFKLYDEGANLCYTCHEDAPVQFKKKYVHKPVKKGECAECHEVHSSDNKNLVVANSPELCYSCHEEFEKDRPVAMSVHNPSFENEESCSLCHTPHASTQKRLLTDKSKQLCLNCHNEEIEFEDRIIANIEKQLDESSHLHKALKKRCTSCHNAHFSKKNVQLLKETYPTANYAKGIEENYALCFNCHDTDLLNLEKTTTMTEFRNGDVNLHYLHINKDKGRTCTNCHDSHAANNTKLIAKTRKFGKWNMPLEFEEDENGGSCKGCHKKLRYDRNPILETTQ